MYKVVRPTLHSKLDMLDDNLRHLDNKLAALELDVNRAHFELEEVEFTLVQRDNTMRELEVVLASQKAIDECQIAMDHKLDKLMMEEGGRVVARRHRRDEECSRIRTSLIERKESITPFRL
jgi:uncharacterized protein YueI